MFFDDLLLRTNELLKRFPGVLAKYQDRFRYILVDGTKRYQPFSIFNLQKHFLQEDLQNIW